jgi:hypothetical protein
MTGARPAGDLGRGAATGARLDWSRQRGGRSSLASQPTASVFRGSTDIESCSVRPQVEHSNVRISKQRGAGAIRASAIRCLHARHIGRSLVGLIMTPCPAHRTQWAASVCQIDDSERDFYGRLNRRNGGGAEELISQACPVGAACVAPPPKPQKAPQGGAALTFGIFRRPAPRPADAASDIAESPPNSSHSGRDPPARRPCEPSRRPSACGRARGSNARPD